MIAIRHECLVQMPCSDRHAMPVPARPVRSGPAGSTAVVQQPRQGVCVSQRRPTLAVRDVPFLPSLTLPEALPEEQGYQERKT